MERAQQSTVVVLLVLTVSVLPSQGQGIIFEGSGARPAGGCRTPANQNGWCRDINKCPPVLANANANAHKVCGYHGGQQIVCCPISVGLLDATTSSSVLPDVSAPLTSFTCGTRKKFRPPTSLDREKRFIVVGGVPSIYGDWPWAALIGEVKRDLTTKWICNGALINHEWVLTAAHCLISGSTDSYIIRLGELDYDLSDDTRSVPKDFRTSKFVIHPDYNYPAVYNDIALIHLGDVVTFSTGIQPICLPWDDEINTNLNGESVTLAGWGATQFGGSGSSSLQEVSLTVFDRDACTRNYASLFDFDIKFPKGFTDGTLCVGDARGGKDACSGDSGAALVYRNNEGRFTVAGTVATGYGCGDADYPGVYIPMHNRDILAWVKSVAF